MAVSLEKLADFLFAYALAYREAHALATTNPPRGAGYPPLLTSPFLSCSRFDVYLACDGVVINEIRAEPNDSWYTTTGPAFKVDYEDRVLHQQPEKELSPKPNVTPRYIYGIVAKSNIPPTVWRGEITNIVRRLSRNDQKTGITLSLLQVRGKLKELVSILSFGAFGIVLRIRLPSRTSQFGNSYFMRGMGVFPADLNSRRFFHYLEIHGQADVAAWDERLIGLRVERDLRRDLALALIDPLGSSGTLVPGPLAPVELYVDRLASLGAAIDALRAALARQSDDLEAIFHSVLKSHPLLLDVYGACESKPRFAYPGPDRSATGKAYLEPDFIVKYPDCSYKLIEIERPSKAVATLQGQPRAEFAQSVFQLSEWQDYIKTHYQELRSRYPGIHSRCKTAIIMSRTNQRSFKNIDDIDAYKGLILQQFKIDEFYTFDDLYDRAVTAYARLSGLGIASVSQEPPGK